MSKKKSKDDLGYQLGLISFIRPSTVLRQGHRFHTVSPKRYLRASGVFAGGVLGSPLRMLEQIKQRRALAEVEISEPPVFIIGHWRSGTTHLHNLMSQDDQFGCVRMFQALAPDCSLVSKSWLPQAFSRVFPSKRPNGQPGVAHGCAAGRGDSSHQGDPVLVVPPVPFPQAGRADVQARCLV